LRVRRYSVRGRHDRAVRRRPDALARGRHAAHGVVRRRLACRLRARPHREGGRLRHAAHGDGGDLRLHHAVRGAAPRPAPRRDAGHIRHFTHWAYHDFAAKRGSLDFFGAVSGIEQALWDLAGKRLGVPVVSLLGGPCRERIRVYANGWYSGAKTPADYAAKAKA